jgi:hypothetical protein
MATLHDAAAPRKRLATYGKAARRRIPDFSFASRPQKSQTPEVRTQPEIVSVIAEPPAPTLQKLKSPSRARSVPRTAPPASPPKGDVFDVPSSDDEAPKVITKERAKAPVKPQKAKVIRQRSLSRAASSVPPPNRDIFDVPEDEEDIPKLVHKLVHKPVQKKALLPSAMNHQKLKPAQPAPNLKAPLPPSSPPKDVFDVPSSGDEAEPTPRPIHKVRNTAFTKVDFKPKHIEKASMNTADDLASRKRMKMSPVPEPLLKRLPANAIVRPPRPRPGALPQKNRQPSPSKGQFVKVVPSRPKKMPPSPMRPQVSSTPQKLSPAPQREVTTFSTPSPQLSDIDMMDADPTGNTISPRGLKLWQGLLESAEVTDEDMVHLNGKIDCKRTVRSRSGTPAAQPRTLSRSAGISKSQKSPAKLPRRRLIDTLVQQAPREESDEESEEEDEDSSHSILVRAPSDEVEAASTAVSRSQSVVPESSQPAMISESQNSQISGPKFTYSRQRSMLEEKDFMQELALGMSSQPIQPGGRRGRRGSIPALKPLTSFHEEDDEDSTIGSVRNVHELRKAGANNRFLDKVQDYLDRIGKPDNSKLSMRRSGLLDLASKMKEKEFAEKFRANGMEMKLFMHLGQEQDIVAGYIMVSLLITVLIDGSIPHVIAQLRRQGLTRLLIRLLDCQSSIAAVVRDRKTNMSKVAQSLVAEHHEYLLKLPAWDELQPQFITPRTLALKCIERMVRQTREAGNASDIFSKELTTDLFAILKSGSQGQWWDLPKDRLAIDFYLALSALESHSITARTVHDESIWISDYLPIIADTVQIALSRPLDSFGEQQALILRLTLNVTNNNAKASDVFARPVLMSILGRTLVEKFRQISRFLTEEDFAVVMEHLVLNLGVMINLADRSPAVRESLQSLKDGENDPLDSMVQTFLDNQERTSMVSPEPLFLSSLY